VTLSTQHKLSTHYYVLSLSERTNRLYEAFRGSLIDIQNTWFPFESVASLTQPALNDVQLRAFLQTVDHHFAHYYEQDPLGMVLVGTERNQTAFTSVTAYPGVIIGATEGDHSTTSLSDLGSIVWPIVKSVMASAGDKVARELEAATRAHNVAVGIDAVIQSVDSGVGATLLVENDFQSMPQESSSLLDDDENVVDVIIEKVLTLGGNVIFVEDGSLSKFQSIALILRA
jgi:Bacterial archaeo-eukaryotic release factor family 3